MGEVLLLHRIIFDLSDVQVDPCEVLGTIRARNSWVFFQVEGVVAFWLPSLSNST
ncbi:MAG: hypothetical protein IPG32_13600 [Saprospirales bacterium]|nr:hypothetical protein [Saprospirales bacterium]